MGGKIEITELQDTLGLTPQKLEEALHLIIAHSSNIHRTPSILVTNEYLSVLCYHIADQLKLNIFNKHEPWISSRSAALSYSLPVELISCAIHQYDGGVLQWVNERIYLKEHVTSTANVLYGAAIGAIYPVSLEQINCWTDDGGVSPEVFAQSEMPCEVSGQYVLSQKYSSSLMRHVEEYSMQHGGIELTTLKRLHVTNIEKTIRSIFPMSLRLETCFICGDVVAAIDAVVVPLMHKIDPLPILWKGLPIVTCLSSVLPVMLQDEDVDLLFRRYDHKPVVKATTQFHEVIVVSAQFLEFLTATVAKSEILDVCKAVAQILQEQEVDLLSVDDATETLANMICEDAVRLREAWKHENIQLQRIVSTDISIFLVL